LAIQLQFHEPAIKIRMSAEPKAGVASGSVRARLFYVGPALVATWIVWGSTYLAIKIALPVIPPFLQMGSRFLLAGTLLLLIEKIRGTRMPSLDEWRSGGIVGTLLLVGGAGGTAFAERSIASGLAASFVAFEPALILLISLAFKMRPTRHEVVGIALGLAGVALLIRGNGFSSSPSGLLAMSAATVSWSAGSVLATNTFRSAPGAVGAASQMVCGGLIMLLLSYLMHEPVRRPVTLESAAAWLYLVVFGSMVAFTAFAYLLAHARTSIAMSYTFVNPIVALLLGSVFGAEHFTGIELAATAVIATGVLLLLGDSRPQRHED
jgi:drug/metabolite transporter (DMT)-like permease